MKQKFADGVGKTGLLVLPSATAIPCTHPILTQSSVVFLGRGAVAFYRVVSFILECGTMRIFLTRAIAHHSFISSGFDKNEAPSCLLSSSRNHLYDGGFAKRESRHRTAYCTSKIFRRRTKLKIY